MSENNFIEVFSKLNLSRNILSTLSKSYVEKISVNNKEKILNVKLNIDNVVREDYISQFRAELVEQLPFVSLVNLDIKFNINNSNIKEKVDKIWDNIMFSIKQNTPFSYNMLKTCEYDVIENELQIKVNNNSIILRQKETDKHIEKIVNQRLGTDLRINIIDGELKNPVKITKFRDKILQREKEMINEIIVERDILMEEKILNNPENNDETAKLKEKPEKKEFKSFDKNAPKKEFRRMAGIKVNTELNGVITRLDEELELDEDILVEGKIFLFEKTETKSGKYIINIGITDTYSSILVKFFVTKEKFAEELEKIVKVGNYIRSFGKIQFDEYAKDVTQMSTEIRSIEPPEERMDTSEEKRVELHLHTQMSSMDGITSVKEYVKRAVKWGHKAIAITDHGVVQAFPDAMETLGKSDMKILYGVEAYLCDDLNTVVKIPMGKDFSAEFVVFDLETTGLKPKKDQITEIGAVKLVNGVITDTFHSLINPRQSLSNKIIKLTGLTDAILMNAPFIEEVLPKFIEFVGDSVLVAHNASFDMSFIEFQSRKLSINVQNTVFDTLNCARAILPDLENHKLNTVAKHLEISLENHHRAVDDATATSGILVELIKIMENMNIKTFDDINEYAIPFIDKKMIPTNHAIILVKDYTGLRNLYELISISHLKYYKSRPIIPKSEFLRLREGLIIGSACEAGEIYKAVLYNKHETELQRLLDFYDYYEIQPIENNMFLVKNGTVPSVKTLKDLNEKIVHLGEINNKLVVATCDVHFIDKEDDIFRTVVMTAKGFEDADNQAPLFFRTTEEMLEEFMYLGEETARKVVITNTNLIADMIEKIKPIPDETFPPKMENAEEELTKITMDRAIELYGDPLPKIVKDRLDRELGSIIKNGFSVLYIIAQKIVWDSVAHGYLVGSRGSVGSSFVATMAGITEVNPLSPHYLCPNCKYSDFESEEVKKYEGASGCDMPDKNCPNCGEVLIKEGHEIPFETFLGFDGDKEPDIDLNFSGEYQAKAHAYTEKLFGSDNVFKAGTISTLADKTAFGYVKNYLETKEVDLRKVEMTRIAKGCTGIKKTTGQHPGGLMVVPNDNHIYNFCPVQRPANDVNSDVTTTHFDYHSISGRLLKLDLLGHDVPTIIRMLHDSSGMDPREVDLGDKGVMSLFTSPKALGVTEEDILCDTGTLGLPEFGTAFVRQMLQDTKPSSFSELVRISGLSHGTDVWINNAYDLIKDGTATLKEIIPTRDDIMVYLINKGVDKKKSFFIMENVRKGKGLKPEEEEIIKAANIPKWYIDSCKKIKYMFPKGHAVAYCMMCVRIGYFKIHFPESFYAATFSVKADDFDYAIMCNGKEKVLEEMKRIRKLGKEISAKEKVSLTVLELVLEMYCRGIKFLPLDLYKSHANKFIVKPEGILPPLCSVQGLGFNVAQNVIEEREKGEFKSIDEFRERTKVTKTVIELLKEAGILAGMSETNQMSLF